VLLSLLNFIFNNSSYNMIKEGDMSLNFGDSSIRNFEVVDTSYSWGLFKAQRSTHSVKFECGGKTHTIRLYTDEQAHGKDGSKIHKVANDCFQMNNKDVQKFIRSLGKGAGEALGKIKKFIESPRVEGLLKQVAGSGAQVNKIPTVALRLLDVGKPLGEGSYNAVHELISATDMGRNVVTPDWGASVVRMAKEVDPDDFGDEDTVIYTATKGLTREECKKLGVEPPPIKVTYSGKSGQLKERFDGTLDSIAEGEEAIITKQRFSSIVSGVSHLLDRGIAPVDLKPENILANMDPPVTVLTDLGGYTMEHLYASSKYYMSTGGGDEYISILAEAQTLFYTNDLFEDRLKESVGRSKDDFIKQLDQYVTYKAALVIAQISHKEFFEDEETRLFADWRSEKMPQIPELVKTLHTNVAKELEANDYLTVEQVQGLKNIILHAFSTDESDQSFGIDYLKSLFPSELASQ
jgi:hypothetical protein